MLLAGVLSPATDRPAATGAVIVDDTFADGNSQNQDLAKNSLWLFNGRSTTVRTDRAGSASFDVTATGTNSEAFWAFFTASGTPLNLGVGDALTVSVTFSLSGFKNNGQDIRWGVLNSLGTRNTTNLTGGMNDSTHHSGERRVEPPGARGQHALHSDLYHPAADGHEHADLDIGNRRRA